MNERHNQDVGHAVKVCDRQAKETDVWNGWESHLVVDNDVGDVADQPKDTDRDRNAISVQTDRVQLVHAH